MQILLQECLAPVAEEVCAEITKSSGASATPLHKIIKWVSSYVSVACYDIQYSKHPRIRTTWFKNLQAEIGHFSTQIYKNLFRLAKNNRFLYKKTLLFCSQNTGF